VLGATTAVQTTDAGAPVMARRRTATIVRRVLLLAWLAAFLVSLVTVGAPFDRAAQTLWILSLLVVSGIGRPWRWCARVFVDWLPFIAVLYLYDYSRGAADALNRTVQVSLPAALDKTLFFGHLPSVWLQQHFYDPKHVHWWDVAASLVYATHFVLVWAIAAVLYRRNRAEWFAWARALVVLSFGALITFALMPSAPPWYAAQEGVIPPVNRFTTRGWDAIGLHQAGALLHQGQGVVNDVAAIPSLHTAFAVLVAVWFWPRVPRRARWWLRPLLFVYPFVMLLSLVYFGEHYVVDGIAGALYVFATLAGLRAWDAWRAGRRAKRLARDVLLDHAGAGKGVPLDDVLEPAPAQATTA
jgi:membrane-associated phospholipid phosphatase